MVRTRASFSRNSKIDTLGSLPVDRLESLLGVRFRDRELAATALTHGSAGEGARYISDNERLEFLGDAVLQLAVSHMLFSRPEAFTEGDMTRFRAHLVRKESLADTARKLNLSRLLRVGKGMQPDNRSVLANCVEAVLAAVFLDQSYSTVYRLIEDLLSERLLQALASGQVPSDPKSSLQQYALAHWGKLPQYSIAQRPAEQPGFSFEASVSVGAGFRAIGRGRSKKAAEQAAAATMLERLDAVTCETSQIRPKGER